MQVKSKLNFFEIEGTRENLLDGSEKIGKCGFGLTACCAGSIL